MTCRALLIRFLCALGIFAAGHSLLRAGGPSLIGTQPVVYRWDTSSPVSFILDNDSLAGLSREQVAQIVREAFEQWGLVPDTSLTFTDLGFLDVNLDVSNFSMVFEKPWTQNPIVLDSEGDLIRSLLGQSAGDTVLGMENALYINQETKQFVSSWMVLNGQAVRTGQLRQVVLHEIGHFLGLDHTQAGHEFALNSTSADNRFVPVMYPFILESGALEPQTDDQAWISWLYPASTSTAKGTIKGRVLRSSGDVLAGANVVAVELLRQADGTLQESATNRVSVISDYLAANDGTYELPGLSPGDYAVYIEPLDARFSGVASVGPHDDPFTGFSRDYYNGEQESGDSSDGLAQKTVLTVSAGETIEGIDLIANDGGSFLVFPVSLPRHDPLFDDTFVGVAIVNPTAEANALELSGVDPAGGSRVSVALNEPLGAQGQQAFIPGDVLDSTDGIVSMIAKGRSGPIQGFFMFGDRELNRMDGIGGELREARRFFFSIARKSATEGTLFFLFNPSEKSSAVATLRLRNQQGRLIKESTYSIPASGSLLATIDQIFGSQLESDGLVEVEGSLPLKGFEIQAGPSDFSALAGQLSNPVRELYAPHFFVDNTGGSTSIRLLNTDSKAATIELQVMDDSSQRLLTQSFRIESGHLLISDLKELLPLELSDSTGYKTLSGHLKFKISTEEGSPARILGSVSFSGSGGTFRSTLPLIAEGQPEALFLHVAQSEQAGMFTGFSILNPGTVTATVSVKAFDNSGHSTAEKTLQVPPGSRIVDLLNGKEFFGADFSQVKGHIQVSSSTPVMTFALFGDTQLRFLAAIEGQKPHLQR